MAETYSFSNEAVQGALDAAKSHYDLTMMQSLAESSSPTQIGELSILAECISVTIGDHKVCINLPLGLGRHCIPIPVRFPDGTAAQACLSICTTWGIPTGVKVSVIVAGVTIVSQGFGKC